MDKMIEEHIATIEIKKELCDKPCDLCKMYGKECMPLRMAKKLAKQRWRKQVEAEWIDLHKGKYDNPLYVCSACRKGAYLRVEADELNNPKTVQALTDYCPHCGAKMKGAG